MHPVRPSPLGKKLRSLAPALWVALSPGLGHAQADPAAPDRPSGAGSQEAAPGTPAAPDPEGVKRVPYLPESLRAEIREQIRKDVLEQARKEGWAAPNAAPGWTKRLQFTGDVRARYEVIDFKRGNTTGWYWDFNAINGGKPLDMNAIDLTDDRWIDVDEDRSRSRLRARLGLEADLSQGFTAQLRLASGDGSSPVSTNQTLGGSTGSFGKYQLWVDRMALRYEAPKGGDRALTFQAGRFENPFFTTDLTWDEDVNLDGLAVQASFAALGTRPFFTAGAFPVFNTALDLAPELQEKFRSRDKWLYAAQLGDEWRPSERLGLKAGIAFYWFDRIEGRVGKDCDTNVSSSSCDTDSSRPSFAQKGNTYITLRTPSATAYLAEAAGNAARYQYFGLASRFRELVATARLDLQPDPGLRVRVDGEWVRNVAFSPRQLYWRDQANQPGGLLMNNFKLCGESDTACQAYPYAGGNIGYLGRLTLGSPSMDRRWAWSVALTYRYLESDAVVDAFTDSDFGLGGTNLKGYVASGSLAVADQVTLGVRWLSSDVIVGPQYSVDILQIDLTGRY